MVLVQNTEYVIAKGPNSYDMQAALFSGDCQSRIYVDFTLAKVANVDPVMGICINSLEYVKSGQWQFSGWDKDNHQRVEGEFNFGSQSPKKGVLKLQDQIIHPTPKRDEVIKILKGPGKLDLMRAFTSPIREGSDDGFVEKLDFKVDSSTHADFERDANYVVGLLIRKVEREDGSGENWLITAYNDNSSLTKRVYGFYSTRTRKGTLKLVI